jgi:hypothetical protein
MRICPNCGAENRVDAAVCYHCGEDLGTLPFPPVDQPDPTQPVRAQPTNTQPLPYPPQPTPPSPNYNTYTPPPSLPPIPPPPNRGLSRGWTVLLVALGVVMFCGFGLAIFTILAFTGGGITRFGEQISTQVADVFTGSTPEASPTFDDPLLWTPSPWPTFTPAPPTETPLPTFTLPPPTATPPPTVAPPPTATTQPAGEPTPNPTQIIELEKLLSPECSKALDDLSRLSNQLTSQPTIPFNAVWRADFAQAVADMRTYCGSLETASSAPGQVAEAQRNLALAGESFDQALRLFNEGVEERSPTKLLQAGRHVASATGYLNQALAELAKIGR